MESSNHEAVSRWVVEQTAYLDPPEEWEADSASALARFRRRIEKQRTQTVWPRRALLACTAAALTVAALLIAPAARVAAQQFWQFLTVRQVAFIRVKPWPDGVPSPKVNLIGTVLPPIPARDLDEAGWRVHYNPRLPRTGVLSGSPSLSTTFPVSGGTVVKVADLQLAMEKSGATGLTVPATWDGAQLALHTSAGVLAEWPDGTVLAQSLPLTLTAPAGFDFPAFAALVLQILGVRPDEAQRMAQRMGTAPWLLAPIDENMERYATVEEVTLSSGPATLIHEPPRWRNTREQTTLIWSVPDRVYVMRGPISRDLAIAAANTVP